MDCVTPKLILGPEVMRSPASSAVAESFSSSHSGDTFTPTSPRTTQDVVGAISHPGQLWSITFVSKLHDEPHFRTSFPRPRRFSWYVRSTYNASTNTHTMDKSSVTSHSSKSSVPIIINYPKLAEPATRNTPYPEH